MDTHSSHLTAPVRSRSSQSPSPSHSASASATSSIQKRKLASSDDHAPPFPSSFSDTRDGALTSNDDLESISVRGAEDDSESDDDSEEVVDDDDEYDDSSMRTFTASRLGSTEVPARNTKLKTENSVKVEPSEVGKDGGTGGSGATTAPANASSVQGIAMKEDTVKNIFTENIQTSGAYSAREESLKREEEAGRLKFVCVSNDGIDEHMVWLIGLKNIFARQLPNMPKEYIVRLVMDRNHKSVMVIRRNQVVGGITYRPYVSQMFGEIAFCAITADEQVKGYGTRLMNHLKQHARDVDRLTHFLTYADNNAVGYFIKQKEAGIPKKIVKVEDIPGLREAGWTPDQWGHSRFKTVIASVDSASHHKNLSLFMRSLLKAMHDHPDAWPFKEPVDAHDVPDYYDIIKDPIDLKKLSKRVESEQYYVTFEMFVADVKRMFCNARTYNSPETIYYKCTNRLETYFFGKVQSGVQSGLKIQH
ncbi:hypothetical protein CsSME_00047038 [Camellia sinensis var. sinensis]|uniref:histone acetyltransferase GCN5 isoform X2 n=1 Tax=Camellia sinensis TaxID=4442 RepID=UPI001035D1B1|nr:histone acetyltransferase GCN5 isoform X2 [Camellia sinensis]